MCYSGADVEVVLNVAHGAARGGRSPLGARPKRSEGLAPRGLHGKPLRPPPPPRPPTDRNWGVRGAARPPGWQPAPGVVGGPVRG